MARFFNPSSVPPPQAEYHHGVLVPAGAQLLYTAGQLGFRPDGSLADGIEEQARWAFRNLVNVLREVGFEPADLIKIQLFLKEQSYLETVEAVRNEVLGDARPASTLMVVKSLAKPEFLFEVEGVAATG